VVFVRGAAPDEEVEAEVVREKGRFLEAETVRVLQPGPTRAEPKCPIFGECGGCATQHVEYPEQVASKTQALRDALARVAKLESTEGLLRDPWVGPQYAYRSRARFAVAPDGTVGFRRAQSHGVVQVSHCPVLVPALNAKISDLSRHAGRGILDVEILAVGEAVLVADAGAVAHDDGFGVLHYAASSFSQSNLEGNLALLADIELQLGERPIEDALELYAGHGNFTRVLAKHASRVVAIEGDEPASALARAALPKVDHRAEPVEAAVEGLARAGLRFDLALSDPPRAGMSASVLKSLARLTDRLLYVSCDVGTFARDVARLREHGLLLRSVRLFDFYPHTPHGEVLGVFLRV
jgi:23S rRNA (uracil1939-C5)-methyltransferase